MGKANFRLFLIISVFLALLFTWIVAPAAKDAPFWGPCCDPVPEDLP